MSLGERAFGWMLGALRRCTARRPADDPVACARRVELAEIAPRLRLLASLAAGRPVTVRAAHGGSAGLCGLDAGELVLPAAIDAFPTRAANRDAYLVRAVLAVTADRIGHRVEPGADTARRAVATLRAMPAILASAAAEWPGLRERWRALALAELERLGAPAGDTIDARLCGEYARILRGGEAGPIADLPRPARTRPRWTAPVLIGELATHAPEPARPARDADPAGAAIDAAGRTEREARAVDHPELVEIDAPVVDANPIAHAFHHTETADEYPGGDARTADGSDELGEHGEALDELEFRRVTRGGEAARSLLRSDAVVEGSAPDVRDAGAAREPTAVYDEWDSRRRAYRAAWCSVYEDRPPAERTDAVRAAVHERRARYRREIAELRRRFDRVRTERRWRNRETDGPELDLDALVDRHATLRSGHSPDERLHARRRRHERDLATLVLLDTSLSTDAWVKNRRVLDVARDSVFVLGEVLAADALRVAVAAFSSRTRRDCRFALVKHLDEPWSACHARLFALAPSGYTRIGPAVRHATRWLAAARARRKLLLIVSDGKPTDFDRYEGRYGVDDVRQALREARARQIHGFALAVEAEARHWLPRMFGRGGFAILPDPVRLPAAIARVLEDVTR